MITAFKAVIDDPFEASIMKHITLPHIGNGSYVITKDLERIIACYLHAKKRL